MALTWTQSSTIPLNKGVNDLTYTNDTYILVSDIPSGDLGTIALSPIATSSDLNEWTVQKRINPNFKNTRLLTVDNITYYIGTEQNYVTIYSTTDNVNFTRVRKFYNFVTDTSKSRVRKTNTTYIITLMGGFVTFNGYIWNVVTLSEEYKDYYVLDATYYNTVQLLLCKNYQYVLATYTNNELTYSISPFTDNYIPDVYYGLVSNQTQLLILGSRNLIPFMLIKESNSNWVGKQLAISEDVYASYEYSLRDGVYVNNTWIFVGVKGKYNGPDRIFITENSLIYTNTGIVTVASTIEQNTSPSVCGLDRVYYLNNKLIALGTGYPNNDNFLLISN